MNVKKFVAKDIREAFEKIKSELGSDAIILNSRTIRKKGLLGLFSKPVVEVYAAYDEKEDNSSSHKQEDLGQIQELENKISTLNSMLSIVTDRLNSINTKSTLQFSDEIEKLYYKLLSKDVSEDVAKALMLEVKEIVNKYGDKELEVAQQVLKQLLGEPYILKTQKYRQKVAVFVGPTGVGKTTTIAKLAAIFSKENNLKVGLVTADSHRVAAYEQLKRYADILDIPICSVYSNEELEIVLSRFEDRDLIFIDTPGKSPYDTEHEKEIKDIIEICKCDEVFLTISASTCASTIKKIIESYSFIDDYKLIITKLDESTTPGGVLNAKFYSRKPIAYLTTGQNVPENIKVFNSDEIVESLLGLNIGGI